jgi:hypothetical protein
VTGAGAERDPPTRVMVVDDHPMWRDIPDDDHIDPAGLDRRDQLPEAIACDLLERGVPVILEGGHDLPAAAVRVLGPAVKLGRHRLRRVVSLAQAGVHARPGLGFRPVFPGSAHASIMQQKSGWRIRRRPAPDAVVAGPAQMPEG